MNIKRQKLYQFFKRAMLLAIVLVFVFPIPVSAQEPSLQILEEELSIAPDPENGNEYIEVITIKNNGPKVSGLRIKAVVQNGEGDYQEYDAKLADESNTIEGYSVSQIEISFPNIKPSETLTGYLIAEVNENVYAATVPLTINYNEEVEASVLGVSEIETNKIIWLGVWVAVASLLIITIASLLIDQDNLKKIFQAYIELIVDWKESWASTLTVFAGTLTTLIASDIFPEDPSILTKTAFQSLQLFFPILVLMAAFIVTALCNSFSITINADTDNAKTYAPVYPLVIGSSLVLAAFIGELATLTVLFEELNLASLLSDNTTTFTQVLFVAMMVVGIIYVIISVTKTVGKSKFPPFDVKGRAIKPPRASLP